MFVNLYFMIYDGNWLNILNCKFECLYGCVKFF